MVSDKPQVPQAELRSRVSAIAGRLGGEDAAVMSELLAKWDKIFPSEAVSDPTAAALDGAASEPAKPAVTFATIDLAVLREFMKDALVAAGTPEEEAVVAGEVLEWADLHGVSTHGIGRLKPIYIDRINAGILKPTARFEVVRDTETTALVDGHGGLGLFIGPKCMDMCIDKAKAHGLGMVVVRNSTHYGAAGYYVDKAQARGCIGITGTNARPSIAPTFGVEPMLGTNPITFGMPSDDPFPFILDCATSVNQRGKIEKYAREGKPTPPGQVVDRDGNVRTDTEGILRDLQTGYCSLAPLGGVGADMGGYKGYGYATVVELLSSALCSGNTSPALSGVDKATGQKKPMPLGHFFIAIDVERFLAIDEFKHNTGSFLRALRNSEKDPKGPGRIYTAGELEHEGVLACEKNGGTLVPDALQRDMIAIRERYESIQTKYPRFSFEE